MSAKTNSTMPESSARSHLRLPGVPVFVYHGLAKAECDALPRGEEKFWIPCRAFQGHLDEIRRHGLRNSSLGELLDESESFFASRPSVILTFDDGRESDYELAFPSLQEASYRGNFFVSTSTIGKKGFLTWSRITEMKRAGMSIQSHGHDHVDLTELPDQELDRQISLSKQMLEDRIGCSVGFLAAPFGSVNRRVAEAARKAGYHAVCRARCLPAWPGAKIVNRVVLYRHTTPRQFRRLLERRPWSYFARMAWAPLYRAKSLFSGFQPTRFSDAPPQEQA